MTAGDRARAAAGPEAMRGYEATMRRMIYAAGVALAATAGSLLFVFWRDLRRFAQW